MAFVVKEWKVSTQPDQGEYVRITGREGGLVPFLLSLVKIDPTVTFVIDEKKFQYEVGSLEGFSRKIVPFGSISSAFYGLKKPWKVAAVAALVVLAATMSLSFVNGVVAVLVLLLGLAGVAAYYFLNKTLQLGVVETSGVVNVIHFKSSVIEGQTIDEKRVEEVILILKDRVETQK